MNDDDDELASLRNSKRFQQHQTAFGRAPATAAAAADSNGSGSGGAPTAGGFRSAAQRKLDALNAANHKLKAREGQEDRIRALRASAHDDEDDDALDEGSAAAGKKQRTAGSAAPLSFSALSSPVRPTAAPVAPHSAARSPGQTFSSVRAALAASSASPPLVKTEAASSSAAAFIAASSASARAAAAVNVTDDDDDDQPAVVSDASAAEQAMLASMFGTSSFGAAPKKGPDIAKLNAAHVRKDREPSMVKVEGAPPGADHSTQRPMPRKVPVPVAPAALLGGSYDSSDEEDDGAQSGQAAAASSSSSSAAAASAAASSAAALSTDDEESDDESGGGAGADPSTGRRPHPLLRTLPISHEVELKTNGHTKTVSALALDKAGARVVSGAYDYQCKLWDFAGMNESMAAFRTWEPTEGHQVRALQFSPSGDSFLCVTGGATPKVYSRDGIELCELARGDMYIMDQSLTRGHSTAVTSGWWHPTDRGWAITSGIDGTVRVWDVNKPDKNVSVIKPRGFMRGVACSATALSRDGKIIAAAYTDGSIHLLKNTKAHEYRDDKVVTGAHVKGSDTSALLFSADGFTLWSRGGDGDHTLKQWDTRAFKQPVSVLAGLENSYPETDMALSPDERVLVTGTSSRDGKDRAADGHAVFIDRASLQPIQRVSMGCKSVVRSVWHAAINQLLFGCSDGAVRLLYDPQQSTKGALQCIGKRARTKSALDFAQESMHVGAILTPHALPSMRGDETKSRKRAREKTAEAMAPEAPLKGRYGVGGRTAGSQSMAAFHLSKVVAMKTDPREKDPREALLAMDALTKADPMFFTGAYKYTQPKPIFAEVPEEERMVAMTQQEVDAYNKKEGQTKK